MIELLVVVLIFNVTVLLLSVRQCQRHLNAANARTDRAYEVAEQWKAVSEKWQANYETMHKAFIGMEEANAKNEITIRKAIGETHE